MVEKLRVRTRLEVDGLLQPANPGGFSDAAWRVRILPMPQPQCIEAKLAARKKSCRRGQLEINRSYRAC
jgi:hypothetical protein